MNWVYNFPPFSWLRDLRIMEHRVKETERLLFKCYSRVPMLHYENCSDRAKFALFTRNSTGLIIYKDPKKQTVD